jgi:RNA polymerase sigma-70 factor (ECF subfamily)
MTRDIPSLEMTERVLVERLQAGDEEAFSLLVNTHQRQLLGLAMTFVDARAVAEEIVQDTWLAVVRGVDRFEGKSSVKTWLCHILANRARSAARRERRTVSLADVGDAEDANRFGSDGAWTTPPVSWTDAITERLAAQTLNGFVHDAIASLPLPQRQVLRLRDVEGLSAVEVCAVLDLTDGYQRKLLHHGRVAVRRSLERVVAES